MMRNCGYQMSKGLSTSSASAFVAIMILGTMMMAQSVVEFDPETVQKARTLGSPNATVNVTVTDDVGRPMENAEVRIVGGSGPYLTDVNGSVQIAGLYANDSEPGTSYNFSASKTGYESTVLQAWIYTNMTNNVTLRVEGGMILGTVTSQGAPVESALVAVSGLGYSNFTIANGWYQLDGIPAGSYVVIASKTGYLDSNKSITLGVGEVSLQYFSLTPLNGFISGFISSTAGGPLERANVSFRVGSTTLTVESNQTGYYLSPALPEGIYSVTASYAGFNSKTTDGIPVVRGNVTDNVNLTLEPRPNRLYGVVKAGTLLLPGVNVSIIGTRHYNISNYEGSYQIANITAGIYNVSASLSGYETNVTQVIILAGTDILLLIDLTQLPGAQLWVKVTAADSGAPLVGVLITIVAEDGEPLTQSTNIDGRFAFTGLDPGNFTLQLVKDGYSPIELNDIAISAEENTSLVIQMKPLREGDTGFIFGFDMAHSMMILALFLTIIILAMAVWLRIKTFQAPETAPAVYDEEPEEGKEGEEGKITPEEAMKQLVSQSPNSPSNGLDKNGEK